MKPDEGSKEKPSQSVLAAVAISAAFLAVTCGHLPRGGELNPGGFAVIERCVQSGVAYAQSTDDASSSAQAFLKASAVFKDPRCVNCHPKEDRPLQGDRSLPHAMNVRRGTDGLGKNGLWCSTCHQSVGLPGLHMPPAVSGWELPPRDMPMVFEGESPHELCEHLKDPARNGGRSPEEVVDHVRDAPLVLWGWSPGEGRTPVSMPHELFVKILSDWAEKGAACPE